MKAAILGTDQYHETMQSIAERSLQRIAGYVPPIIDVAPEILPVGKNFTVKARLMMKSFGVSHVGNSNPRIPYLLLAWVLIGKDNPYRYYHSIPAHIPYHQIVRRIGYLVVSIALGCVPSDDFLQKYMDEVSTVLNTTLTTLEIKDSNIVLIHRLILMPITICYLSAQKQNQVAGCIRLIAWKLADLHAHPDSVRTLIATKASEWAQVDDEEVLQIAQQLMLDILTPED